MAVEMTLIHEAGLLRDIGNRPSLNEQVAGSIDAHLVQIGVRRQAHLFAEKMNEMKRTKRRDLRQFVERQVTGEVIVNVVSYSLDGVIGPRQLAQLRTAVSVSRDQLAGGPDGI